MNITQTNTLLFAYTQRTLMLSTAHIPENTSKFLSRRGETDSCRPYSGGWVFDIADITHLNELLASEHPELEKLLQFSFTYKFDYLRLDRDADQLPFQLNMPVFEW